MSKGIKVALQREQAKLVRQLDAVEATQAVIEVLGDSVRERNKLDRQLAAIDETKANISKLEAVVKKLK